MPIVLFLMWILCGVVSAGIMIAFLQADYPVFTKKNYRFLRFVWLFTGVLTGPAGLILSLYLSGFCKYGWRLSSSKE